MPRFVAILEYTDDKALIAETRPRHREYLKSLYDAGRLWLSGPWADDTGAMLMYEAADAAEAERMLEADPYRAAGVVVDARIREWRPVMQRPVEG